MSLSSNHWIVIQPVIVGCYVDDLCCLYDSDAPGSLYADFVSALQHRWKVEDEGPVSDLLNVEFSRLRNGDVRLTQGSYIDRMVQRYLAANDAPIDVKLPPCDDRLRDVVNAAIQAKDGDSYVKDEATASEFQSILGSLLYCATNSRPDVVWVAFAVAMLGRAMSCPTTELLERARHVLRYLRAHRDVGLTYSASCRAPLSGMSDASWETRHSTSGFNFQFGQASISWSSKKQPSVALSSCEAEIMAASEATKEAIYLRHFLEELDEGTVDALSLSVDNKAAIDLAYNPEHHQKLSTSSAVISTCARSSSRVSWWSPLWPPLTTWPTSSPRLSMARNSLACVT